MTASDNASYLTFPATAPVGVRIEQSGASVVVTLDRPDKLNALNSGMKAAIANEIPIIARDPQVYAVIFRAAASRMFSAGGDIREIYDLARASPEVALAECAREYGLIWLLDCFSKPTLALIDGPVLGTGAGMTLTTTHRVGSPAYRFQMPETQIGYFPDNGVAWHLAQIPHNIGTWLGLTGASIGPADAHWLGLLTHCIDASHFDAIAAALADAQPIDPLLDGLAEAPAPPPLRDITPLIERCFGADSISGILRNLAAEREHKAWCEAALATLAECSPLALATSLELIRRARYLDLRQVLVLEYRLARTLSIGPDFLEGVRARVIEKRGNPAWTPLGISDVGQADIERLFQVRPTGELILPTRQEMQAARV